MFTEWMPRLPVTLSNQDLVSVYTGLMPNDWINMTRPGDREVKKGAYLVRRSNHRLRKWGGGWTGGGVLMSLKMFLNITRIKRLPKTLQSTSRLSQSPGNWRLGHVVSHAVQWSKLLSKQKKGNNINIFWECRVITILCCDEWYMEAKGRLWWMGYWTVGSMWWSVMDMSTSQHSSYLLFLTI